MREVAFRGWNGKRMVTPVRIFQPNGKAVSWDDRYGNTYGGERHPLMEFTGLKDKNGKAIYEGDILQHYSAGRKTGISEVKWHDNGYWIIPEPLAQHEVIGNVYENPELIN